jgi:Mycothiol maleylpyruvate isomerase N-terminal domain
MNLWDIEAFDARPLFRAERLEALTFPESLTDADWARVTSAGEWTVKHVALHLLDGDLQ